MEQTAQVNRPGKERLFPIKFSSCFVILVQEAQHVAHRKKAFKK